MLGRRSIPCGLSVLGGLIGAECREIAYDISVCAAAARSRKTNAVVHGRVDESRVNIGCGCDGCADDASKPAEVNLITYNC